MELLGFLSFLTVFAIISAVPQQGKFEATLTDESNIAGFFKTLYTNSTVRLKITNSECKGLMTIKWLVRSSSCYGEYESIKSIDDPDTYLKKVLEDPTSPHTIGTGYYAGSQDVIECGTSHFINDETGPGQFKPYPKEAPKVNKQDDTKQSNDGAKTDEDQRRKRDAPDSTNGNENPPAPGREDEPEANEKSKPEETSDAEQEAKSGQPSDKKGQEEPSKGDPSESKNEETKKDPIPSTRPLTAKPTEKNEDNKKSSKDDTVADPKSSKPHRIAVVPVTAPYLLIVQIDVDSKFKVDIAAEMETPLGYLSAHEYPLKTFYMIMCIVYTLYAVAWLVMSACNFKDLLRVQFWIGGVILLGMVEKAVFYSEYMNVNTTGISVMGAAKFAEVVSALKRSLARMLVIIVSLGFGIVKPRLGPMLHRVIGIGILYFILAIVEALVRNNGSNHPGDNNQVFASIPLAIVDSVICWWIFMSLMQTMKTLRLRRNVVKLTLYRHFSNTIIFCVIASLAMIFYSFRYRDPCATAWRELWVNDAFWHVLFSIILLVIMVLWRPNINNQRYAFSPLIDGDEEEGAEEPMLGSGATETVKMRGLKNVKERQDPATNAEESLKWIEENIPQSVADAALPAIMDSDEEIMTTKYEMSKME